MIKRAFPNAAYFLLLYQYILSIRYSRSFWITYICQSLVFKLSECNMNSPMLSLIGNIPRKCALKIIRAQFVGGFCKFGLNSQRLQNSICCLHIYIIKAVTTFM